MSAPATPIENSSVQHGSHGFTSIGFYKHNLQFIGVRYGIGTKYNYLKLLKSLYFYLGKTAFSQVTKYPEKRAGRTKAHFGKPYVSGGAVLPSESFVRCSAKRLGLTCATNWRTAYSTIMNSQCPTSSMRGGWASA